MRILLIVATLLQVTAVVYCILLLRTHRVAARAWLCLLGALLSMLVWRIVVTTGITPGLTFNTVIAIWGSVCAVLAMTLFAREIAYRERAEAERDRLLASERTARGDAERANRTKDDFLATLSHELRTPLAAILGWCSILRTGRRAEDTPRALEVIERNARVQARLIDDLLDATRMQAGSLRLEVVDVPLEVPVAAALEGIRPSAEAKGVDLQCEYASPGPVVHGDPNRLQQIAANLIVNAVKFTDAGKAIRVVVTSDDSHAVLTVADQGIGIEASFLPHLFERFRQAETGNARRHGGLGLGLSIASSLTQLHNGEIIATSGGLGHGSTFTVRLPLAVSQPQRTTTPSSQAIGLSALHLHDVRVLLVDDEADVRSAVAGLLEQAGATVRALESGHAIEDALADFRPDVLLLDIGMPGEDGYSLVRRIRLAPGGPLTTAPAISLTAHARDEDRQHALDSGFQAHLTKPVQVSLLISTIRRLVGERNIASSIPA